MFKLLHLAEIGTLTSAF